MRCRNRKTSRGASWTWIEESKAKGQGSGCKRCTVQRLEVGESARTQPWPAPACLSRWTFASAPLPLFACAPLVHASNQSACISSTCHAAFQQLLCSSNLPLLSTLQVRIQGQGTIVIHFTSPPERSSVAANKSPSTPCQNRQAFPA